MSSATPDTNWQNLWDARQAALASLLGKPDDTVLHAPVPFHLGGAADVLTFRHFVPGVAYVTADLTGPPPRTEQLPAALGHYELMICPRHDLKRAADMISNLACHTREAVLEPGHTMDIGAYFADATLRALLFTHPRDEPLFFDVLGQRSTLLLCMGITAPELAFARKAGSAKLLALLKHHKVFPHTTPDRPSIPLGTTSSFLGRIFGK